MGNNSFKPTRIYFDSFLLICLVIESNNKAKLAKLAKKCKTDNQKIDFFDSYQEAFFSDLNAGSFSMKENVLKALDDAFYVYANMKRFTEDEFDELKELTWKDYPRNFKIFLFDFCILDS
tara:strand:- start:403 stop:762 length:360 start_codon:yes stop_codon:yes gene_type:complete